MADCKCQTESVLLSRQRLVQAEETQVCAECKRNIYSGEHYHRTDSVVNERQAGGVSRNCFRFIALCRQCELDWSRIRQTTPNLCPCLGNLRALILRAVNQGLIDRSEDLVYRWHPEEADYGELDGDKEPLLDHPFIRMLR